MERRARSRLPKIFFAFSYALTAASTIAATSVPKRSCVPSDTLRAVLITCARSPTPRPHDMDFQPERQVVAFLGLVHFRVAFPVLVLGWRRAAVSVALTMAPLFTRKRSRPISFFLAGYWRVEKLFCVDHMDGDKDAINVAGLASRRNWPPGRTNQCFARVYLPNRYE
jgi:hypothetical protein